MKRCPRVSVLRRIMTMLCIAIFLLSYINATMFMHCHNVHGTWVYHSHISDTAHRTSHSDGGHTAASLQLIADAGQLNLTDSVVPDFITDVFQSLTTILPSEPVFSCFDSQLSQISLRGPPSLV